MTTFSELGIKKSLSYLNEAGFTEPFPIQAAAIPIILKGSDMIGQAQTGTGKTAAFGLPLLEIIDHRVHDTQGLIIVPTRELAQQVAEELKKFSGGTAKVTAVYGGESMLRQIRFLKNERQIIVATPGRLMDYMREEILPLGHIRFVVLDEADRMLDMGFIDDIKKILSQLPQHRQMCMFSATMPTEITRLAHDFMNKPEKVVVSKDEISNVNVSQYYMEMRDGDKLDQLANIIKDGKKTVVFCGAKVRVKRLADELHQKGFNVEAIHGDMEQNQRSRVIQDFKADKVNILVATDVVARGIDVPTVERVVSFDVPTDTMTYFHRIGRTARAGEKGAAIIFVTRAYWDDFNNIRNHTKVKIVQMKTGYVQSMPVVRSSDMRRFGGSKFGGGRFGRGGGGDRGKRGFGHGKGPFHHGTGSSPSRGRRRSDKR